MLVMAFGGDTTVEVFTAHPGAAPFQAYNKAVERAAGILWKEMQRWYREMELDWDTFYEANPYETIAQEIQAYARETEGGLVEFQATVLQ